MIKPLRTLRGENANTAKQGNPEFFKRQLPQNPLHPTSSHAPNGHPPQLLLLLLATEKERPK